MVLNLIIALVLIQAMLTTLLSISVANGGSLGDWGRTERCPKDAVVKGFNLLVERPQGDGDDTALNGIKLYCAKLDSTDKVATISSTKGSWGEWIGEQWCSRGYFIGFSLRVEKPTGRGDDTAANSMHFKCSDLTILDGFNGYWGDCGHWSGVCHTGICGLATRVERPQGNGDDTALNDAIFDCC